MNKENVKWKANGSIVYQLIIYTDTHIHNALINFDMKNSRKTTDSSIRHIQIKKKLKIIMQKQHYWLPSTTETTNKTNWNGDTLEILCICYTSFSHSGQTALAPCIFSVAQQSSLLLYIHTYILFSYITYYCRCRLFVSLSRRFLRIFFFYEQHRIKKTKLTFWFQIIGMCWSIIYVNLLVYKIGS